MDGKEKRKKILKRFKFRSNAVHRNTSVILQEILSNNKDTITIGKLSEEIGDRGFGLVILLFALPNTIPLPIPGVSTITSLPLIFISLQLCLGMQKIWLPCWIAKREIKMSNMHYIIDKSLPCLKWLEKFVKTRNMFFTSNKFERFAGFIIFILSCLLALPIPLGNLLPGISVSLVSLAIAEQDGILMILGLLISFISIIFVAMLISGYGFLIFKILSSIF